MKFVRHATGWVREKANVVYEKAVYICDHHTYTVPVGLGFCAIVAVIYLFIATATAMSDMKDAIKSIPVVVQTEMEKTRAVLQDEAVSNREAIADQHQFTREELERRLVQAEYERKQNRKAIDEMSKKLDEKQKRSKILGIF